MGEWINLTAEDGFELKAYRAEPEGPSKGGIVVIMEIFGVNSHIRSVCDKFAAEGYTAVAPAVYDRLERDFEVGYTPDDIAVGRQFKDKADWNDMVKDARAAYKLLDGEGKKVGIVGFCMGGTVAWLGALRIEGMAGAVGYYGGQAAQFLEEKPKCPTLLHFGEFDKSIPLTDIDKIRQAHPDVPVNIYPADHGFNCDQRGSYHADSAKTAWGRTIKLFSETVG
jgi:carboxymethylenebutenolidase